jgi:shikimate kinase
MDSQPKQADELASPAASRFAILGPRVLALIGYRGTGKSTVARHLALALGWDWVDADVELELRAGKTISAIFADDGELAFRDLESQVLADLVRRERVVLAAGGGVVLREANRKLLKEFARVVWLQASAETIVARIATDATTSGRRPNLTVRGGADEVIQLLRERTPLYEQCADLTIDTEQRTPGEVVAEIVQRLQLVARTESA